MLIVVPSGSQRHRRDVLGGGLRVVAGAGQWARLDVADAEALAFGGPPAERRRVDPALHRQVVRRRPQVLADRHDVDAEAGEGGERRHDLVARRSPGGGGDAGRRSWPIVTLSTPSRARSASAATTSSSVSPIPTISPDFVVSPAALDRARTDRLRA